MSVVAGRVCAGLEETSPAVHRTAAAAAGQAAGAVSADVDRRPSADDRHNQALSAASLIGHQCRFLAASTDCTGYLPSSRHLPHPPHMASRSVQPRLQRSPIRNTQTTERATSAVTGRSCVMHAMRPLYNYTKLSLELTPTAVETFQPTEKLASCCHLFDPNPRP